MNDPETVDTTRKVVENAVEFTCCGGFFGGGRRRAPDKQNTIARRSTVYHDCMMESQKNGSGGHRLQERSTDCFYSAFQELNDSVTSDGDATSDCTPMEEYPIVTTSHPPPKPERRVSILEPPSLLEQDSKVFARVSLFRRPLLRRSVLLSPNNQKIRPEHRGFPGHLRPKELEECMKLYHALQVDPTSVESRIVYKFADIEDTAQTLCRFLRHDNFSAQRVLQSLKTHSESWKEAEMDSFYPNLAEALGMHYLHQPVPIPVFLTKYPYIYYGTAKNGCPVSYFQVRNTDTEGIQCLTDMQGMKCFLWNSFVCGMAGEFARQRQGGPIDPSRPCQAIQITDLKGVSRSLCTNSDVLQVVQMAAQIGECFPETLHIMILINAPVWFSAVWRMVCTFLPARLAQMIQVYSSATAGKERLFELIDIEQIPSDFGGSGPTLQECIQLVQNRDQSIGLNERVAVESFQLTARKSSIQKELCTLQDGETCTLKVYTRSATNAVVNVQLDSVVLIRNHKIQRAKESTSNVNTTDSTQTATSNVPNKTTGEKVQATAGSRTASAYCTDLAVHIKGPGSITIALDHCDRETAISKNTPCGYFLVAATITSQATNMPHK